MSRGLNRGDNDRLERPDTQSRVRLSPGRAGGGGETGGDRADRPQGNDLARSERHALTHEREEIRCGRQRNEWSLTGHVLIGGVGRFRTLDEEDVERVFYSAIRKQFQTDFDHLSKQGLLLRRSVSVVKKIEIRCVAVLSKRAKRLAQYHRLASEWQAVYAGFVKPAEVSHVASIYKMYEAEANQINAAGGRVNRVVLDFEFKKKIYAELNKKGDYGDLSYVRRQQDLAKLHELPIVDGKISLPDLRIEYETADGERAHIDLELATEHYRPAHVSRKLRTRFKVYGVNSTSRGCRAEWEGRELSAEVLAL